MAAELLKLISKYGPVDDYMELYAWIRCSAFVYRRQGARLYWFWRGSAMPISVVVTSYHTWLSQCCQLKRMPHLFSGDITGSFVKTASKSKWVPRNCSISRGRFLDSISGIKMPWPALSVFAKDQNDMWLHWVAPRKSKWSTLVRYERIPHFWICDFVRERGG